MVGRSLYLSVSNVSLTERCVMKKTHAASWGPNAPSPAQLKELFAQCESGRVTGDRLQRFLKGEKSGFRFRNESWVREIMGEDIIFPQEVATAFNIKYSEEDLRKFEVNMPSQATLRWCKESGFAVVAGPPTPTTLSALRSMQVSAAFPELFDETINKAGLVYMRSFATGEDKEGEVRSDWLIIRKNTLSLKPERKFWFGPVKTEQLGASVRRRLDGIVMTFRERSAFVVEILWLLLAFFEVKGVRLLEDGSAVVRINRDDSFYVSFYRGVDGAAPRILCRLLGHNLRYSTGWRFGILTVLEQ